MNMVDEEVYAKIAEEVVFVNMIENMPCKKKKVYHITEMQI